jgi:hypothetical protein
LTGFKDTGFRSRDVSEFAAGQIMALTASLPRIEEHRVTVVFDCPHCRSQGRGTAYDLRETIRVSNRVPRWGWQSHWVRCARCNAELHADCAAEDLHGVSPKTVNEHVRTYVTFPRRVLALSSLLLCWTPVVGVIVSVVSLLANLKTRGWPRWGSVVALFVAITFNVTMYAFFMHANSEAGEPVAVVSSVEHF